MNNTQAQYLAARMKQALFGLGFLICAVGAAAVFAFRGHETVGIVVAAGMLFWAAEMASMSFALQYDGYNRRLWSMLGNEVEPKLDEVKPIVEAGVDE